MLGLTTLITNIWSNMKSRIDWLSLALAWSAKRSSKAWSNSLKRVCTPILLAIDPAVRCRVSGPLSTMLGKISFSRCTVVCLHGSSSIAKNKLFLAVSILSLLFWQWAKLPIKDHSWQAKNSRSNSYNNSQTWKWTQKMWSRSVASVVFSTAILCCVNHCRS